MKDITKFYTYLFKNYKDSIVPVTVCVKSEQIDNDSEHTYSASWDFDYIGELLFRAISIGIAVYNTEDTWDYSIACKIAEKKADKSSPVLYTAASAIIDEGVMEALAKSAFDKFVEKPDTVIPRYSIMRDKYIQIQTRNEEIDKLSSYERETLDRLAELKRNGELDKFVDLL